MTHHHKCFAYRRLTKLPIQFQACVELAVIQLAGGACVTAVSCQVSTKVLIIRDHETLILPILIFGNSWPPAHVSKTQTRRLNAASHRQPSRFQSYNSLESFNHASVPTFFKPSYRINFDGFNSRRCQKYGEAFGQRPNHWVLPLPYQLTNTLLTTVAG